MKGIVVEQKKKKAVVLCGNGEFRMITDRGYRIGQEIELAAVTLPKTRVLRYGVGVAAALMICTGGVFAYTTPTGYVSLDVNPSIAYSINMFDRVLSVTAVNDDSQKIVEELDLKNLSIGEALDKTTKKLIEEGYITDAETNDVFIAAYTNDAKKAEKLAADLEKSVAAVIEKEGKNAVVESEPVGRERVLEAEKQGITPGKLNQLEKQAESAGEKVTGGAITESKPENPPAFSENKSMPDEEKADNNKADKKEEADTGNGENQKPPQEPPDKGQSGTEKEKEKKNAD